MILSIRVEEMDKEQVFWCLKYLVNERISGTMIAPSGNNDYFTIIIDTHNGDFPDNMSVEIVKDLHKLNLKARLVVL